MVKNVIAILLCPIYFTGVIQAVDTADAESATEAQAYGLVMVDLKGTQVSSQEEEILRHPLVGSVILFSRNMESSRQLKELTGSIRGIKPNLLLAVDHEGGNVQRFQRDGFRSWPAARVYGDVYDLDPRTGLTLARNYGQGIGTELADHDIDMDLAPVLDLHTNSDIIGKLDRAFHADPHVVAELGSAFSEGLEASGTSGVGKHFPNHAVCKADSHIDRPSSDADLDQLSETYLVPFRQTKLKAVMPAHITFPKVDPDNPVSLSRKWLTEILRDDLQFDGAIISDCLSMKGADVGSMSERALRALNAGCDIIIICHQPREALAGVLTDLQASYRQDEASQRRIAALARKK